MLGAEKPTRQQNRKQSGANDRRTADDNVAARSPGGPLVARSGIDAVNATEARICGSGAVNTASIAEGLALAGRRAATLLTPGGSHETHLAGTAPWVHHRLSAGRGASAPGAAFELVAATAQEAVDHCLVAHRLALGLGRPGLCTLDGTLAHGLHLVRLPDAAAVDGLAAGVAPDDPAGAGQGDEILPLADEALESVSALTGRRVAAVAAHGSDDASSVLLASGAPTAEARRLAERLSADGYPCRTLTVSLVRPFPADALVRELKAAGKLIVFESQAEPVGHGLAASVRRAIGGKDVEVERLAVDGKTTGELYADVSAAFGRTAENVDPETSSSGDAQRCFTIGIRPASGWSEQLLLETAAHLGTIGEWNLSRPPRRVRGRVGPGVRARTRRRPRDERAGSALRRTSHGPRSRAGDSCSTSGRRGGRRCTRRLPGVAVVLAEPGATRATAPATTEPGLDRQRRGRRPQGLDARPNPNVDPGRTARGERNPVPRRRVHRTDPRGIRRRRRRGAGAAGRARRRRERACESSIPRH